MSIFKKILVDVPDDKGVHTKVAGAKNEKYVYKHVQYFRDTNGKPRNKSKSIGKLDTISGRMYPNDNYYELYHIDISLPDISIWEYGYTYLVLKVCHDIGLMECLSHAFGTQTMEIIIMAAYILREGSVMDAIDDWQQKNYFLDYDRLLTSKTCSRAFASLAVAKRYMFFDLWVANAYNGGCVCYDVTSVSSYAKEIVGVERGYNRDGDDLCQFNLGMFCDEDDKTPLYYSRYNGSITDKTNLPYVLASAKALGIERVKMVVDGGFWSEECIKNLNKHFDAFTIGMPASLKESERMLTSYSQGIETYENELVYRHVYCISVNTEIYGVTGRVLIFFDAWSHLCLCDDMHDRIDALQSELAALKRYPKSKLSRYTPYFMIAKHTYDTGFNYAIDVAKVEQLRKTKGFFLLFSNDMTSSPSDILYYYRAKDADEKIFEQIKYNMGGYRIHTHNEETTDGKTFVIFIACIIRSYMLSKLSKFLTDDSTSLKKIFNQLSNITIVANNQGRRFTKALTKKQKQILSAFGADHDILSSLTGE